MIDDVQYFKQPSGLKTAYRFVKAKDDRLPTLIFLPGYMSDMDGGKACAIFDDANEKGYGCLLLDYTGCGKSDGEFIDGNLSIWRDEICALIDAKIMGDYVLIGSSMGGWLMLMTALQLAKFHDAKRLCAMIGIASAPDFTNWDINDEDAQIIIRDGVVLRDNDYGYDPTPMHRKFYEDGQANLLLDSEIAIDCPVRLFHGQNDQDVPHEISLCLAAALRSSDVHIHLIKDADHRFSRDQDIAMLVTEIDILIR